MHHQSETKKIAVISMVRNDDFFTPKWIDYYSAQFGSENLFLVLDGMDQPLPAGHERINIIREAHKPMTRLRGDKYRSRLVSDIAKGLFNNYEIVIACDIDEYLVCDPKSGKTLAAYLSQSFKRSSLSALGLDVGQHIDYEKEIDLSKPFLQQRSFAHVSARYTKAIVALCPVRWGSGYHRVKGKNFFIDPNLFLFHFGMVDYNHCRNKISDKELNQRGWTQHFNRRFSLFEIIRQTKAIHGDQFFEKARRRQTLFRPFFSINKPGMLREKPVIEIPARFKDIV